MIRLYAWVLMLLTLTACYSPGSEFHSGLGGRSETGSPALHAIHDKNLRELMGRMDALMLERIMSEQDIDIERRKYARRIAANAKSLGETVDSILETLPSLQLTSDEQRTFRALAQKLLDESRRLEGQAQLNQIDAINGTVHEINTTCTSCHALFRKLGG